MKNKPVISIMFLFISILFIIISCQNGMTIFNSSDIELVQLTYSFNNGDQDWSPDGKKIIFVRWIDDQEKIWEVDLKTRKATLKFPSGFNPSWNPVDENIMAFQENGNIYLMKVRIKQQITNSVYFDFQPTWNPDGNKITFTRTMDVETIWIMNSDGTDAKQLTNSDDNHCLRQSFSHDGTQIVYINSPTMESDINEIWVMNIDGSNKYQLFAPGNTKQKISKRAWNKNNKIIFSRAYPKGKKPSTASDLWIINADGSEASPILESFEYSYNDPVWNNQGNRIAVNISSNWNNETPVSGDIYFFSYE